MMFLLFQNAGWFDGWTWQELVLSISAVIVGFATVLKAIKEIRAEGWQPTKEKFVAWITLRRTRKKRMDVLIDEVREVKGDVKVIGKQVEHIQARVKHQDETSDSAIFELNAACHLTFANCRCRELVNADEQELRHRSFVSRTHPDDRSQLIRELQEAMDNKMPIDSTVRFRYDQTHFIQVRMLASPNVQPDGELIGFFGRAARVEILP